ncbi:MAG TPA: efflux RND transporter periplasmic adaptor subunit [Puia sp.]|nr:efflux RND transporter periplasmic adaptor subunit [Puia sp.]
MRKLTIILFTMVVFQGGCSNGDKAFDAEGVFEADEIIVSSEVPGKIMALNVDEGSVLKKDSLVAVIDSVPLVLQRSQVEATIGALGRRTLDVRPQVDMLEAQMAAQQAQLADLDMEKARTERLIRSGAAPTKQLDDYNAQISVLQNQIRATREQIGVQKSTVGTQNSTVWSEYRPLRRSVAQIQDQVNRTCVYNPAAGTVLVKYAMAGEVTAAGKALYKIADLSVITLRIYVTGTQLAGLRLGQPVKVFIDEGPKNYRGYTGSITLIAEKAEFTPKTIQTKEERANLVYAVKIRVKNDGLLKIGMYGQVKFN